MYDISAHPYQPQPDMINKSAGVVNDPAIDLGYAKLHEDQQQRRQAQEEHNQQLHAKMLDDKLSKVKDSIRPADQEAIAKKQSDYAKIVEDNIEGMRKGDTKSILAINEAERNLNSTIAESNALYQKETAISHGLKGDEYGFEDWNKSTQTPYVDSKDSYVNHIPKAKQDLQKEWNTEYVPGLIQSKAMSGYATNNPDGSTTWTTTGILDKDAVDSAKEKMFLNSKNAASEIHNRFQYEKNSDNPSSLKTKYAYQDQEGEKLDYKQAFKDALYTPDVINTAHTGQKPQPAQWQSAGATAKNNPVNFGYLPDNKSVVEMNDKVVSLTDANGRPLNTNQFIVKHDESTGEPIAVEAKINYTPAEKSADKEWSTYDKLLKDYKQRVQQGIDNAKKTSKNLGDQKLKEEEAMIIIGDPPPAPKVERPIYKNGEIVPITDKEQVKSVLNQFPVNITDAYKGGLKGVNYTGRKEIINTPEQKSDKKTWQEMNGVKPKKKITGF